MTLALATLSGLAVAQAAGGELTATISIPQLSVAEYHRPYTAIWVQTPRGEPVLNLATWYDTGMADAEGETWLKDLRQWWRRIGRSVDLPLDGISGPTRAPGTHTVTADAAALAPGDYQIVFEAAREVGGREILTLPFTWPMTEQAVLSTEGDSELGRVTLTATSQE